jgi:hypothetical protein
MVGAAQHLTIVWLPSNWMAHMLKCAVKIAIKMAFSKVRLRTVFHVMLTQPGMLEHLERIALRAILLPLGIRRSSIYRIQNPEPKMAEAAFTMATPLANNAIQPRFMKIRVKPVTETKSSMLGMIEQT